jgi:hypothetical protein
MKSRKNVPVGFATSAGNDLGTAEWIGMNLTSENVTKIYFDTFKFLLKSEKNNTIFMKS